MHKGEVKRSLLSTGHRGFAKDEVEMKRQCGTVTPGALGGVVH